MKSLKFDHQNALAIQAGKKHLTWRIDDDKDLRVNDIITVIDRVNPRSARSWKVIGTGEIRSINEKRLGDITEKDKLESGEFAKNENILSKLKHYYGKQLQESTPVKIIDFNFTSGYQQAIDDAVNIVNLTTPELKVYADGGSRGNPGPSASGYVLLDMSDKIILKNGLYLGNTTNNQAEYHALRLGLEKALELNAEHVHVFMDSLLVINQMKGLYKIKNRELLPVYQAIKSTVARFQHVDFTHVPRELNKLADGMVNEVLDATEL